MALAKKLSAIVTPSERRLYFRTASAHMASGCPMLALDVLMRLPRTVYLAGPHSGLLKTLAGDSEVTKFFMSDSIHILVGC